MKWHPWPGKRKPRAAALFVRLRNGMEPQGPWPVERTASGQTRWTYPEGSDDPFDIIFVRKAD
jgi:hypothetical protein